MERQCAKCGTQIEEGVAFCPSCNAPQIRVTGISRSASGEEGAPLAETSSAQFESPGKVRWAEALPSAALAGFLLAVAMLLPGASPVLLMFAAGGFATFVYARRSHRHMTARLGARVGVVGGLFGFIVLSILMGIQILLAGGRVLPMLRAAIEDALAKNPNPQAQELLEKLMTPGGLTLILVLGMLMFLAVVLICSAVGGGIAGWLLGRRDNKQPPG